MDEHARMAGELGIKVLCAVIWTELLALECGFKQYNNPTIAGSMLQRQAALQEKPLTPAGFCNDAGNDSQTHTYLNRQAHFV